MEKQRAFLKWAGGKYRCLDHILPLLPPGKRLIEPFAGSGVVFLNTHYAHYHIAEKNTDLIHLYRCVQEQGHSFIEQCKIYFSPQTNTEKKYYELREQFNHTKNTQKRAMLFLYLNRHGYNGLCRYNGSGQFNVPFGAHLNPYFPERELLYFHHKSQTTTFTTADFEKTFQTAMPEDVIYCDPPYVPLSKTSAFSAYIGKKFTEQDQIRLAQRAKEAASRGVRVLISNHDTPFTRQHYHGSMIHAFNVQRNISCIGAKRQVVQELLAVF